MSCKIGAWFALDVPQAYKSFWTHSMVPLGDEAQVAAHFGLSDMVLILTQDRCTVSSNVPLDQKSFWTHPMELLGDVGHVESQLFPFGDSVSVGAR